jgi:AcrR family transcriptional regulator
MNHQNLHQLARDRTRNKILEAGKELFISKGFSGTSMAALAKAAGINQSLFYHYFESKEELWRQVKSEMLKTFEELSFSPAIATTLDELLKHLIEDRLNLYLNQPDLVRMLLWQSLEESSSPLLGLSSSWVESWLKAIESFQDQGIINTRFTPQEIFSLCSSIAWTPFLSQMSGETRINPALFSQKAIASLKMLLTN